MKGKEMMTQTSGWWLTLSRAREENVTKDEAFRASISQHMVDT